MPYDIIESCYDQKYVRMPRKWKKRGEKKEEKKKREEKKAEKEIKSKVKPSQNERNTEEMWLAQEVGEGGSGIWVLQKCWTRRNVSVPFNILKTRTRLVWLRETIYGWTMCFFSTPAARAPLESDYTCECPIQHPDTNSFSLTTATGD